MQYKYCSFSVKIQHKLRKFEYGVIKGNNPRNPLAQ